MKKNNLFLMIIIILLSILAGCKSSTNESYINEFLTNPKSNSTDNSIYFKGIVFFENMPVKGAKVYIKSSVTEIRSTKETDKNGEFTIIKSEIGKDLFQRNYIFEIKASGFKTVIENIDLRFNTTYEFNIDMKPEFGQNIVLSGTNTIFSGIIIDKNSSEIVEEAFINVGNKIYTSNSDGEFIVETDEETITIERNNYEKLVMKVDLNNIVNANEVIYLKSLTASIKGTILENIENKKLSKVNVSLLRNNIIIDSKQTNENGEFQFYNLKEEGNYLIKCEHNDYNEYNYSFVIKETKDYVLSPFTLEGKKGEIRGKIIDVNTGDGLEGAAIALGNGKQAFSDSLGNYIISNINPGVQSLKVILESYRMSTKTVFIEPNKTESKNIFIQQEYGNSNLNIIFYTSDNKELDHNLVTLLFLKYPANIQINEETDDFIITYDNEAMPVEITFGESEESENGMNIINVFSGKYKIYSTSYISAENNTTGITPGAYYGEIDNVIVSPGKTTLYQMILGTEEIVLIGEEE
ncbi:MAG: hypothetical protein M0R46_08085 [Candidatus Muirbacterium halophilum]|nr:hypothetical protein [Candidatus Muirbacterium halophilum]